MISFDESELINLLGIVNSAKCRYSEYKDKVETSTTNNVIDDKLKMISAIQVKLLHSVDEINKQKEKERKAKIINILKKQNSPYAAMEKINE